MKKKEGPKQPYEPEFEIIDDEVPADGTVEYIGDEGLGGLNSVADNSGDDSVKVQELQSQVTKLTNDYLYLRAEFDNYRRQAIKERSELIKYGGERLAKDLLDTLDIFDTALNTEVTPENLDTFVKGIQMTAQQLRTALQKHGIQELPAEGLAFDPTVHEALSSEISETIPPGHVSTVFKKAYKYHDKILRPAQVIVAKENEA
jgi:molecular chaperone GrpE